MQSYLCGCTGSDEDCSAFFLSLDFLFWGSPEPPASGSSLALFPGAKSEGIIITYPIINIEQKKKKNNSTAYQS